MNRLEEMAGEGNRALQMLLPMAEMVGWLHKGVGELIRQAGLQLMQFYSGWRESAARGGEEIRWRLGADSALPSAQAAHVLDHVTDENKPIVARS